MLPVSSDAGIASPVEITPQASPSATARRPLVPVVAGVLSLAILLLLAASWFRARAALNDYRRRAESVSGPLLAAEPRLTTADHPLPEVLYEDLTRFVELERASQTPKSTLLSNIGSGQGMWFWLSESRARLVAEMESVSRRHETLARAADAAAKATASAAAKVAALRTQSRQSWERATASLNTNSDSQDFEREFASLEQTAELLSGRLPSVTVAPRDKLEPLARQLRLAVHAGFKQQLMQDIDQLHTRSSSLTAARQRLAAYKTRARSIIDGNENLLTVLGVSSRVLQPASELAFAKSRPVRQFLDDVDRPLAGNAGSLLSGFLGSRSAGPVSALSIATDVDPRAKILVAGIREVLDVIEGGHREIQALSSMTGNLIPKAEAFVGDNARASLLQVAQAAPATVQYFDSRKGLFNPAVEKMERLRPSIAVAEQIASRLRIPLARTLFLNGASTAATLLDLAEKPFREGNQIIDKTSSAFHELDELEREYAAALLALRDSTATATASTSAATPASDESQGCATEEPVLGDLNGDTVPEKVILQHCSSGGTASDSRVLIFAMRGGNPVEIARLQGGDRAFGGIRSVQIDSGRLVVDQNRSTEHAPMCCPDFAEVTAYELRNATLVPVGSPQRRKLE